MAIDYHYGLTVSATWAFLPDSRLPHKRLIIDGLAPAVQLENYASAVWVQTYSLLVTNTGLLWYHGGATIRLIRRFRIIDP